VNGHGDPIGTVIVTLPTERRLVVDHAPVIETAA